MDDSLARDDNNMLLAGLIVVSMLLHGLLIFILPTVHRPQRTSYIELTVEEIPHPARHAPPSPLARQIHTKPAVPPPKIRRLMTPDIKPAPQLKTISKANPMPLVKPTPQPGPIAEVVAPPPSAKLPEPMVQPDLPLRPNVPAVKTNEGPPTVAAQESEEAATSEASAASLPAPDERLVSEYLASIRARIERNKKYPLVARSRQLEGEVTIRFILTVRGEMQKLEMRKSSGVGSLDRAAIDAVRQAAPFANPPEGFIDSTLPMELTIIFKLN